MIHGFGVSSHGSLGIMTLDLRVEVQNVYVGLFRRYYSISQGLGPSFAQPLLTGVETAAPDRNDILIIVA